jgi:hypothetical protein
MKGAMHQVASQCVQGGGGREKGVGQEKEEKVRRQSCEEDERCFIDRGQVLGAAKAARGGTKPEREHG